MHNKNFVQALYNAFDGIIYATTTQSNVKKQLLGIVLVMIVSLFMNLTRTEFLFLIFACVLVILAEMLNTAIETVVDLYVDVYHPKAKIAKDVGAGAVIISSINALIIAYFVLYDKITTKGITVLQTVAKSPVHLIFVSIILTVVVLLTIKAANVIRTRNGKKEKFIPSGQTALAMAVTTLILLNTKDIVITTLAFLLSLMIGLSRIENNKRTGFEVFFGGIIGILVVIVVQSLILIV